MRTFDVISCCSEIAEERHAVRSRRLRDGRIRKHQRTEVAGQRFPASLSVARTTNDGGVPEKVRLTASYSSPEDAGQKKTHHHGGRRAPARSSICSFSETLRAGAKNTSEQIGINASPRRGAVRRAAPIRATSFHGNKTLMKSHFIGRGRDCQAALALAADPEYSRPRR